LVRCDFGITGILDSALSEPPSGAVGDDRGGRDAGYLVDAVVKAAMDSPFFEDVEDTFGNAVSRSPTPASLGFARHKPTCILEVLRHEAVAAVTAGRNPMGCGGFNRAEDAPDRHGGGIDHCVAVVALGDTPAKRLSVPMVDGTEQADLAVFLVVRGRAREVSIDDHPQS
jgi:hypothetical protein